MIGEKSLLFGNKLYQFELEEFGDAGEVVLHEGNPGFLEISSYLKTTKAPLINVLRIPVPAAAREQAVRAHTHIESQISPENRARLHATFGDHFEAAGQPTDAPHRMQRRRKIVLPLLALFILTLAGLLAYRMLQPNNSTVPTYPTAPAGNAG